MTGRATIRRVVRTHPDGRVDHGFGVWHGEVGPVLYLHAPGASDAEAWRLALHCASRGLVLDDTDATATAVGPGERLETAPTQALPRAPTAGADETPTRRLRVSQALRAPTSR